LNFEQEQYIYLKIIKYIFCKKIQKYILMLMRFAKCIIIESQGD
jgi:hypothetical protein